jgi:hypothetical protein
VVFIFVQDGWTELALNLLPLMNNSEIAFVWIKWSPLVSVCVMGSTAPLWTVKRHKNSRPLASLLLTLSHKSHSQPWRISRKIKLQVHGKQLTDIGAQKNHPFMIGYMPTMACLVYCTKLILLSLMGKGSGVWATWGWSPPLYTFRCVNSRLPNCHPQSPSHPALLVHLRITKSWHCHPFAML